MRSKRELLNIKTTIYINRSLENEIMVVADEKEMKFNETVRFLLQRGLENCQ